jgi:chorismate mutase/prephenate dehydratase
VLASVAAANSGPLSATALQNVFRELIGACRDLETRLRVAYLGPEFTYSHLAAIHRFGQSAELVPVASIPAVFEEVSQGQSDFGLVPMENSTDGRVTDTLDMFTKIPLPICGEVPLRIHHCLLGRGPRSEVRQVLSKPQALSQCRNWLARHLPQAQLLEVASTADAAQRAGADPSIAAVASRQAGVNFNLDILAANIEDVEGNLTRFAVIGHQPSPKSGDDKTSLMFEVEHKPGALADAMGIFKRNRLNLTWIESFPVPGTNGRYLFFVELLGHNSELMVRKAIRSLERKALRFEVLGSYARTDPIG